MTQFLNGRVEEKSLNSPWHTLDIVGLAILLQAKAKATADCRC